MGNGSAESDYFSGFKEKDYLNYCFMGVHIIITLIGPTLLLSIIWYENYVCEARFRTVVNILLSHVCWMNLVGCLGIRIPYVAMMNLGPHSREKCDGLVFMARLSYFCITNQILLWQMMKYLYIFHWKYAVTLNEKWIACFTTTANLMLSIVYTFVTYLLGYHNINEEFHICTGINPMQNINQTQFLQVSGRSSDNMLEKLDQSSPMSIINTVIWISMVFVTLRIWLYSQKDKFSNLMNRFRNWNITLLMDTLSNSQTCQNSGSNIVQTTMSSLIGSAGSLAAVMTLILLMLPARMARDIFIHNVEDINHGNGRTWIYISRISRLLYYYCLLPTVLICSNTNMRLSVWDNIKKNCLIPWSKLRTV